MESKMQ